VSASSLLSFTIQVPRALLARMMRAQGRRSSIEYISLHVDASPLFSAAAYGGQPTVAAGVSSSVNPHRHSNGAPRLSCHGPLAAPSMATAPWWPSSAPRGDAARALCLADHLFRQGAGGSRLGVVRL